MIGADFVERLHPRKVRHTYRTSRKYIRTAANSIRDNSRAIRCRASRAVSGAMQTFVNDIWVKDYKPLVLTIERGASLLSHPDQASIHLQSLQDALYQRCIQTARSSFRVSRSLVFHPLLPGTHRTVRPHAALRIATPQNLLGNPSDCTRKIGTSCLLSDSASSKRHSSCSHREPRTS